MAPKGYVNKFDAAFRPDDSGPPVEPGLAIGSAYVSQKVSDFVNKVLQLSIPKADEASDHGFADKIGNVADYVEIPNLTEFLNDYNNVAASFDHHLSDSTWKFVVRSQEGCLNLALEGAPLDPFPRNRIIKADFFVRTRNGKWAQLGGIKEQSVGSDVGGVVKRQRAVPRNRLDCCDPECVTIGVNFFVAKYLGGDKSADDDVKFVAQGHPIYAKKAYLREMSPVMDAMFSTNWVEGTAQEVEVHHEFKDLVLFLKAMEAISPGNQHVPSSMSWLRSTWSCCPSVKIAATLRDLADYYGAVSLVERCDGEIEGLSTIRRYLEYYERNFSMSASSAI